MGREERLHRTGLHLLLLQQLLKERWQTLGVDPGTTLRVSLRLVELAIVRR
jgi:hypothetical protein